MSFQPSPGSPRRKSAIRPLAICGCLVLTFFGIVAVGVSIFRADSKDAQQAKVAVEPFLVALEKPDDQAAFDMMSIPVRKARTVKNLTDTMERMAKKYGHPRSHRQLPVFDIHHFNGEKFVRLVYQETFEKGEMPVQIDVVSENEKWRVLNFTFHL